MIDSGTNLVAEVSFDRRGMHPHRKTLVFSSLAVVVLASILYDTLFAIGSEWLRPVLALLVVAGLGGAILLEKYPLRAIQPAVLATWPLHLFTLSFVVLCVVFHGGARLGQVIAYTVVGYAAYALLPLVLILDLRLFAALARLIAICSALFAIPSYFGAMGFDVLFGLHLRNKISYSNFSGIIASGGLLEHPEGLALQMAAGLFCCIYAIRKSGGNTLIRNGFILCFFMILAGLVISQGRGAIFGVVVAVSFSLLPELFRRSRPIFFGSLLVMVTLPVLVGPQLANIPGIAGYFRIKQGLSGREEAWRFGLELVKDKPWIGHGFLTSSELTEANKELLRESGFSGIGTTFHNTFVTKAVELGLIATFLYSLMYIVPLSRICTPSEYPAEQQLVRSMILLAITTSVFRDYNIGGVRSTAMMGAVFLGVANLWPLLVRWQQECPLSTAAGPQPSTITH